MMIAKIKLMATGTSSRVERHLESGLDVTFSA